MSDNVVQMPGVVEIEIATFTQIDRGEWTLTKRLLNDEQRYRRLVRTRVEELLAMYRRYPLPEFELASAHADSAGLQRRYAVQSTADG